MSCARKVCLLLLGLLACLQSAAAQQTDPRVADLVQSGILRVGIFPPQYLKDETTGEPKSAWVEVARVLAASIGVRLVLVEQPTPIKDIECLKASACDVIFLPLDKRAADIGDFSPPYMQFEYTLLVPAGSSIRRFADADQVGVRIAAVRNHASTNTLAPLLKRAELVYAETPDPAFDLLRNVKADAMASVRPTLLDYSAQLPGSRVLEDHYGANLNRVVILKGNPARLAYINEFVEHAKASGLVQKAIDRAGPRGLTLAPPGNSN